MSENIIMPTLGLTMESGVILSWKKEEGDRVDPGDVLLEIESDKSTAEIESDFDGVLLKRYYQEGEEALCGEVIAVIGTPGEEVSEKPTPTTTEEKHPKKQDRVTAASRLNRVIASPRARKYAREHDVDLTAVPKGSGSNGRIEERDVVAYIKSAVEAGKEKISPVARKIAEQGKVDTAHIKGSGPAGKIVKQDVLQELKKKRKDSSDRGASGESVTVPLTNTRRIIAKRLGESKKSVPHYYLKIRVNMEEMIRARAFYHENRDKKVSLNSMLMKITAAVLEKHPYVNSSWDENGIVLHPSVNIAVAVATDSGLITPVVKNCQDKGVVQIDNELKELIGKAREGTLTPAEYSGHTITFSNLGMYGIEEFSAIINIPDAAILAVGAIIETPIGLNGEIVLKPMMSMTLSGDHRVIDGADGAEFMGELKSIIETPMLGYFS